MKLTRNTLLFRFVVIILVLTLIIPSQVSAATPDTLNPLASQYLTAYSAYVYPAGSGKIQVWFQVNCDDYMDEVGSLTIKLYESSNNSDWTQIKTFNYQNYSSMLAYNKITYTSHVTYSGTAGKYYKAYVCIWAGKDGAGDTRYFWTSAKKAT